MAHSVRGTKRWDLGSTSWTPPSWSKIPFLAAFYTTEKGETDLFQVTKMSKYVLKIIMYYSYRRMMMVMIILMIRWWLSKAGVDV